MKLLSIFLFSLICLPSILAMNEKNALTTIKHVSEKVKTQNGDVLNDVRYLFKETKDKNSLIAEGSQRPRLMRSKSNKEHSKDEKKEKSLDQVKKQNKSKSRDKIRSAVDATLPIHDSHRFAREILPEILLTLNQTNEIKEKANCKNAQLFSFFTFSGVMITLFLWKSSWISKKFSYLSGLATSLCGMNTVRYFYQKIKAAKELDTRRKKFLTINK